MEERLKTVGFKIDRETRKQLEMLAATQKTSPGDCARSLVIAALNNHDIEAIQERLARLEANMIGLKRNLANLIEVLLVAIGDVEEDEAKAWVNRYMRWNDPRESGRELC